MAAQVIDVKAASRGRFAAFNSGDLAHLREFIAPEGQAHFPGVPGPLGRDAWIGLWAGFRAAFPDIEVTVEDQIAEGDGVVTRWTARGTHQGDLQGLAPTGKRLALSGVSIDRLVDGKVVEHWEYYDQLDMLQQLGVAPTSPA